MHQRRLHGKGSRGIVIPKEPPLITYGYGYRRWKGEASGPCAARRPPAAALRCPRVRLRAGEGSTGVSAGWAHCPPTSTTDLRPPQGPGAYHAAPDCPETPRSPPL